MSLLNCSPFHVTGHYLIAFTQEIYYKIMSKCGIIITDLDWDSVNMEHVLVDSGSPGINFFKKEVYVIKKLPGSVLAGCFSFNLSQK